MTPYAADANKLLERILALPANEVLACEDAFGLLRIHGFRCADLEVTLFQASWALARAKEAMRSAFEKPGVATAMAVHEAFHGNHSPDAEKVAKLEALNKELVEALEALLARDQRNTCQHDETHRGGALWEICDQCGAQWADDKGGKPAWSDPPEWIAAETALTKAEEAT